MRIAFGIVSLFPGGGLQRDCTEIARLLSDRGHHITIYVCRSRVSSGDIGIPVIVLPNAARTNHQRQKAFARQLLQVASGSYDLIVGFDKLLNLDVLYCADRSICYRMAKEPHLRLFPRYRAFRDLERSSFTPRGTTEIILLSDRQNIEYQSAWGTPSNRISVLSPTLSPARKDPQLRNSELRRKIRSTLGLAQNEWVWLAIGVQPTTKGLDRTLRALKQFLRARLLIAGLTETDHAAIRLAERAKKHGVSSRVSWLGHREDITRLMAAADLLVHPARYDTTGTVILEAIVNGLPVITTAACGYASHVEAAKAGFVIAEPFDFSMFLSALQIAQDPIALRNWSTAGEQYGRKPELYTGRIRAADIIERCGRLKAIADRPAAEFITA